MCQGLRPKTSVSGKLKSGVGTRAPEMQSYHWYVGQCLKSSSFTASHRLLSPVCAGLSPRLPSLCLGPGPPADLRGTSDLEPDPPGMKARLFILEGLLPTEQTGDRYLFKHELSSQVVLLVIQSEHLSHGESQRSLKIHSQSLNFSGLKRE